MSIFYKKCIFVLATIISYNRAFSQTIYFINKANHVVYITKRTLLEDAAYPYAIEKDEKKIQGIPLQTKDFAVYAVIMASANESWASNNGKYYVFKPNDTVIIYNKNEELFLVHKSSKKRSHELAMGEGLIKGIAVKPINMLEFKKLFAINNKHFSLRKRDSYIDSLATPIINYVSKYSKINNIDPELCKLYKYNFIGMRYCSKLFCLNESDLDYKRQIDNYYKDSVIKWAKQFNCNTCSNVPQYNLAAKKTFDLLYRNSTPSDHLKLIATNAIGNTRQFLLSAYINDQIEANSAGLNDLLTTYNKLCTNSTYKHIVADNYLLKTAGHTYKSDVVTYKSDVVTLMKTDKKHLGFDELIKQNKGKIIYVDFWASWCHPCLQEIPFSLQLQKKITNEKDIRMIYISIDRDFDSWVKVEKEKQLKDGDSFILANAGNDGLSKRLRLNEIPRYIIIGRDGKFLNINASRPSEAKTYKLLKELVKK